MEIVIFFLFFMAVPVIVILLWAACLWRILRRSLHMYQQKSYQNPSYWRWLRGGGSGVMRPARVIPLAVFGLGNAALAACGVLPLFAIWVQGLALILFLILNRRPADKKPLVFTPRVRRLMITAALVNLAAVPALVLGGMGFGADELRQALTLRLPLFLWGPAFAEGEHISTLLLALWALAQPVLVMAYAALNSPLERLINRYYIGRARAKLGEHPNLTVIGITGSYGKTSTKFFLNELLSVRYNTYMTPGNYNTTLGVVRAIREGLRPTHEIFLCEMGARHRGDIREICGLVRPRMGVLTYIGPQHLETFGSQQAIADTKLELRDAVQAAGGRMFVNWGSGIAAAQAYAGPLTRYGLESPADYRAADLEITGQGSAFTVLAPGQEPARFSTRLLGRANIENLMGAIAVAHTLGIPLERLAGAVRTLKSVPHRLELCPAGDMTLIDDAYNSNPAGAQNALETLALCRGSRVVITPGLIELGEREPIENRALGALAAQCADRVVVVGRRPGEFVAQGALEAGLPEARLYRADTFEAALAHVRALALPDKFVLLLNDLPDVYR